MPNYTIRQRTVGLAGGLALAGFTLVLSLLLPYGPTLPVAVAGALVYGVLGSLVAALISMLYRRIKWPPRGELIIVPALTVVSFVGCSVTLIFVEFAVSGR